MLRGDDLIYNITTIIYVQGDDHIMWCGSSFIWQRSGRAVAVFLFFCGNH